MIAIYEKGANLMKILCTLSLVLFFLSGDIYCYESDNWDFLVANQNQRNLELTHKFQKNQLKYKLKVTTINVGMLNTVMGYVSVPYYSARAKALYQKLLIHKNRKTPDMIFIQELWGKPNFLTVQKFATDYGYELAEKNSDLTWANGLQILIKKKKSFSRPICQFSTYQNLTGGERTILLPHEWVSSTQRGLLWCRLWVNGRELTLANTHLTAPTSFRATLLRQNQLDGMISFLDFRRNNELVFVGGDLNFSGHFKNAKNKMINTLLFNARLYDYFIKKTGLVDSLGAFEYPNQSYTLNRLDNLLARTGKYTRDDPEQRVDYLWVGEKVGRKFVQKSFTITDSSLTFTKHDIPVPNGRKAPLSDHFGVTTTIELH